MFIYVYTYTQSNPSNCQTLHTKSKTTHPSGTHITIHSESRIPANTDKNINLFIIREKPAISKRRPARKKPFFSADDFPIEKKYLRFFPAHFQRFQRGLNAANVPPVTAEVNSTLKASRSLNNL